MRRATTSLLVAATCLFAASCGSTTNEATTPTTSVDDDLETVADDYGRALLLGDTTALVDLIDPRLTSQMTDQDRAALDALARSNGEVELNDFAAEVVRRDSTSADVVFAGERCAPTLATQFPDTTLAGDDDSPATAVGAGSVVEGDVECVDIAEASKAFTPVKFVLVDGRWYGTIPGF